MKTLFILFGFCLVLVSGYGRRQRRIEASGIVGCCYARPVQNGDKISLSTTDFVCSTPSRSKIELYDYNTFLSDELLSMKEGKLDTYEIEWEGMRFFSVKPYVKVHLECPLGPIFDKRIDVYEENPTKFSHNFNIKVPQEMY